MKILREQFKAHVAQTSHEPLMIEVARAEGVFLWTPPTAQKPEGERFFDLISGVSVSNVGHGRAEVVAAVQRQAADYMHTMVYGETVQAPQVRYAARLAGLLPPRLGSVYFVNSGAEAIEGALKLAKRATGRREILAFRRGYHGSTHGSLSVMSSPEGDEWKRPFEPLLEEVDWLTFNDLSGLDRITDRTACVLVEPVQGEAGVRPPKPGFLQALRRRCDETGALLVFDEIQTGMGRTGALFAFEKYGGGGVGAGAGAGDEVGVGACLPPAAGAGAGVVTGAGVCDLSPAGGESTPRRGGEQPVGDFRPVTPDILCVAKAFGGGMPLGAFISSREIMDTLAHDPALGHITTFGGHPVCCAAGLAALEVIVAENLAEKAEAKGALYEALLAGHPAVGEIRRAGLLMAVELAPDEGDPATATAKMFRTMALFRRNGIMSDWFLFCDTAFRISPPLTITEAEIRESCAVIRACLDEL
ncbi:MAG: aspartate aminotransferase family protein [Alistipes sp.]|jgi:acetylornithine/succinyldiaminopimelate/putrescine aminotransferase|nr:aspartate aminotransferase family protein [Alistipes sp.]